MGGGHGGSINYPPGILSIFQGHTERNHVPVLQLFHRAEQEALGRNLALRVDRDRQKEALTAGQGAGQHYFEMEGPQMFQPFQLISRIKTNDTKAGNYRRRTTEAVVTLRTPWRQQQWCEERLAVAQQGSAKLQLFCELS